MINWIQTTQIMGESDDPEVSDVYNQQNMIAQRDSGKLIMTLDIMEEFWTAQI